MGAHAANGQPVIVALPAEIDVVNAEDAYNRLYAAVISGAPVIIADFTATTFCDSSGLNRLIMIHDRAAARGIELRLAVTPGGTVRRTMRLLGLDRLLPVHATVREAASLERKPDGTAGL